MPDFVYSEFNYTFAVWVEQVNNFIKSDSVKNVNHRTGKVEENTNLIYIIAKKIFFSLYLPVDDAY